MSETQSPKIEPWLQTLWDRGGSDLLLSGGSAPRIRVDGKLQPIEGEAVLTGEFIDEIAKVGVAPADAGAACSPAAARLAGPKGRLMGDAR